jgi:cytochrome c oxidase subunit 2
MKKEQSRVSSRILAAFLATPALLALTGCSEVSGLGFEKNASSVNDISLSLWQWA